MQGMLVEAWWVLVEGGRAAARLRSPCARCKQGRAASHTGGKQRLTRPPFEPHPGGACQSQVTHRTHAPAGVGRKGDLGQHRPQLLGEEGGQRGLRQHVPGAGVAGAWDEDEVAAVLRGARRAGWAGTRGVQLLVGGASVVAWGRGPGMKKKWPPWKAGGVGSRAWSPATSESGEAWCRSRWGPGRTATQLPWGVISAAGWAGAVAGTCTRAGTKVKIHS